MFSKAPTSKSTITLLDTQKADVSQKNDEIDAYVEPITVGVDV